MNVLPASVGLRTSEMLTHQMYLRFSDEIVPGLINLVHEHVQSVVKAGKSIEISSSGWDCFFLYLLIRNFRRRHAFELGTFIGTTAVAINAAIQKNEGTFTTTDPDDHETLPPNSGIRFIQGTAEHGLQTLQREGAPPIDFVFADWPFDPPTVNLALQMFSPKCIIAVHDYDHRDDGKGEYNIRVLNERYCRERPGEWLLPGPDYKPFSVGPGINQCTAVFIPY